MSEEKKENRRKEAVVTDDDVSRRSKKGGGGVRQGSQREGNASSVDSLIAIGARGGRLGCHPARRAAGYTESRISTREATLSCL